ncbi:phage tail protein [Falsiroseomonas sp. E2-1-a4]|uniref:phage tail protein n=1 Tax=Falsiroseomonas sp. E2-1-a4 TaxID=3239299 RepID=UPI003F392000
MTSAAALLPPPPRPPHDPLWQSLDGGLGWRLMSGGGLVEHPGSGALEMAALPGMARSMGEPNGSLGGLLLPGSMTLDEAGNLWLLDRARRVLRWFDRCECRFVDAACQGVALVDPRAICADHGLLYIADAGPPGRLLVLDARAMTLRASWAPPRAVPAWQPTAVAVRRGEVLVADAARGVLHRFTSWGGHAGGWAGFGAISRIAVDCAGALHLVRPGLDSVDIRDGAGRLRGTERDPTAIAANFPDPPLPVSRDGAVDLGGWCEGAGWFDLAGTPIPPPPTAEGLYPAVAAALLGPLDSSIARCQWHRIIRDAALPSHGAIRVETAVAETVLPDSVLAALPDSAWAEVPLGAPAQSEALILSPPGRYLWLRLTLTSDGAATPALRRLDIEYPRIPLRRHLPAAFGADPGAAAFADRFLGLFDRGFRDIERRLDDQAALFDARSTPSAMLPWLASWVGITLDRRWPEARRRDYLRQAGKLFACRGTWPGLRGALLLWLGWSRLDGLLQPPASCARPCPAPLPCPPLPLLVLEHWKLRRWLFLGAGRIGDAAELWGAALMGRSQLDRTAQTGVTRLDTTRDPLRDPFHRSAHQVTVFVPAHAVRDRPSRGALDRLLRDNLPAQVQARVEPVHPRMRIGVQASIGFDSVVGCWPSGIALGQAVLGRATVLPAAVPPPSLPPRIGRDARLGWPHQSPRPRTTGQATP